MLDNPYVRLVGRALLVFLTSFLGALQVVDAPTGEAVFAAAINASILALGEIFTPLNKTVGVAKAET